MSAVSPSSIPTRSLRRYFSPFRRLGSLGWLALIVSLLLVLPLLSVALNIFVPGSAWPELAATVLPTYIFNTLWLSLGVAFGVMSMGVVSAWLIASYRFPGHRVLQWALLLPLAMPA